MPSTDSEKNILRTTAIYAPIGSAVGTLTVAAIGIWGVFFTDIPQTLVRQLQSETAEANERLVAIQRTANHLQLENEKSRSELVNLAQERSKLDGEMTALRNERLAIEKNIQALSMQKSAYLKAVMNLVVAGFKKFVDEEIVGYDQSLVMVEHYEAMLAALSKEEQAPPGMSEKARRVRYLLNISGVPEIYQKDFFNFSLRNLASDNPAEDYRKNRMQEIKTLITRVPGKTVATGSDILHLSLAIEELGLLLDSDKGKFRSLVRDFIKSNAKDLDKPLAVEMSTGWTMRDIPAAVERVRENQDTFKRQVARLEARLRTTKWD